MFKYALIFVSLLVSTLSQNATNNSIEQVIENPNRGDIRDNTDYEANCYYICPTWPNIVVLGAIILLLCCICAAVCQQQPREIFYLVDRSPDDRPPALPFDPHAGVQPAPKTDDKAKSQISVKEPVVTISNTPKQEPSPNVESPKSDNVEESSSPNNMTSAQVYGAQESIENETIPLPPVYEQSSPEEETSDQADQPDQSDQDQSSPMDTSYERTISTSGQMQGPPPTPFT